jgi:hypothetical protein
VEPPPRIQRVTLTKSPSARCRRRSNIRGRLTKTWWTRNRRGACSTGLVGYQVSPLLWDKVRRGLSAGRVQTVALRLIVEREREIKAFEKKEYWTIDANLAAAKPPAFDARFVGKGEEKIEVTNGEDAEKIRGARKGRLGRPVGGQERTPAQCCTSVHDQQVATGFLAQAAFQREAHDDDRATFV